MRTKQYKPSEVLLLTSGIIMLGSLPFLTQGGPALWTAAKACYFAGVILYIYRR